MPKSSRSKVSHSVRIVGGKWRGRRISVADVAGLRPTPDRVRETLFNWLAPTVAGARCLDLFAGTGALGFEALSREANHVCFVERDLKVRRGIEQSAATLSADCTIWAGSAESFLAQSTDRFELVFLDAPYEIDLTPVLTALQDRLSAGGLVYVERGATADLRALEAWGRLVREARAGSVHFGLLRRSDRLEG